MCGIAGFTTFGSHPQDSGKLIRLMTDALAHRGPDAEGWFHDDHITLGHRRLSIIDIAGGAQPMSDAEGRYQLIYNGELYNYRELRADLADRGCEFRTESDTEVLLQFLVTSGFDALDRLDGMFAFAFWDRMERRLVLARDRLGIKPLFYCFTGRDVVFASELKALLKHPDVPRALCPLSVSKYFSYGYVPAPHTIIDNVFKIEAGCCLSFDHNGPARRRYWNIPLTDNPISTTSIEDISSELLRRLRESVRRQLRSDVPVGVFLSGGIDSSTITAIAASETSGKLRSFSIGFDDSSYDESPFAREVAALAGTEHHEEILTLRAAAALFPEMMKVMDEPLADASIFPTFALSRLAARHVKVVLGGDGGDELFLGYPAFQAHRFVERLSFLPVSWRDRLGTIARRLPVSHSYASAGFLTQQFVDGLGLPAEVRFFLWMGCYGNSEKRRLFAADFQRELLGRDPFEDIVRHVRSSGLTHDLQRLQYLCTKLYFQDDILTKVDRAGMAHSLETRVPFMGNPVLDYACGIQPGYKLSGFTTKYVLKHAAATLLPRHIVHRRKSGFMMPVAEWLTKDLREYTTDLCAAGAVSRTGIFDAKSVETMLREHFERRRDHRKRIYALVCFMAWLRNHSVSN